MTPGPPAVSDTLDDGRRAARDSAFRRRTAAAVIGPAAVLALVALPAFGGDFELQLGTLIAVYALTVLGLDVVAGRGGLLHAGFGILFGTGAYAVVVVSQFWDGPTIVAVAFGGLLAALISAALGVLLSRSNSLMYAVLTLAAASAASSVVINTAWLGGNAGLAGATRDLFGLGEIGPLGLYLLVVLIFALCAGFYLRFRFTATGRAIEALRLVPGVAEASGVNIAALKIKLSAFAGLIGGVGGALYAVQQQYVSADLLGSTASVNLLAMSIIGGSGAALAGLPGAFIAIGLPQLFQEMVSYQIILVGMITGIVALWFPRGVAGTLQDLWWSAARPLFERPAQWPMTATAHAPAAGHRSPTTGTTILELREASVAFDGVRALSGVSFDLRAGKVHALVGPNGAGKSTLIGFVAGSVTGRRSGSIRLRGNDISTLRSDQRAIAGITRTFQLVSLCETLTGLENVMVGGHVIGHPSFLRDFLALNSRKRERQLADRAGSLLRTLGAAGVERARPGEMTSGQQRLVEIARCLMTDAEVILLDEPAAGLSSTERLQLAEVIRRLASDGRAVLLIEHDMEFVMSVAERITVLVNGAVMADGEPDLVRSDPRIIEAYWGKPIGP
jgi:branched-chain amino acid transport system permease protein